MVVLLVSAGLMVPTMAFFTYELYIMCKLNLPLRVIYILLSILIAADSLWILSQGLEFHALKNDDQKDKRYRTSYTIILMVGNACISLSHWIFSFNYWSVA